jgi:hypothetical protein
MFLKIIQIVLFVIVNLFGFYVVPLIANSAVKFGLMPDQLSPDQHYMMMTAFTYYVPFWAVAAVASIGFFFTRAEMRAWLILAPLYVPALFGTGILLYFHMV